MGTVVVWVIVTVPALVFESLLVCKAYLRRFDLFWLEDRWDDPRPVIDIAAESDPC